MAAIRSAEAIAKKWASVTPQRTQDYEDGVRDPRGDWEKETRAAEGAYKEGVTAAIARGAFGKGVARVGTAGWQEGALSKGVARWGPGVELAEGKYRAGFEPYQRAIAGVTLPPRFARRDPRNLLRVKAIVDAMVKVKQQLG